MWLTVKQLSSYIQIKEKTLYAFVAKRTIPHYRIGKLIIFNKNEIDSWLITKKATSFNKHVSKIRNSFYNAIEGRPSCPKKGVD